MMTPVVNQPATVKGMAEAVEQRRRSLGLTPGGFVTASGLTAEGLAPVRKGYQRNYQDRLILGVAKALRWKPDWYDRLLAGKKPIVLNDENDPSLLERVSALEARFDRLERLLSQGDGTG